MPYTQRRPQLHSRRQTLHLQLRQHRVSLWFPAVEEPLVIDDFTAAASLARCLTDGPVERAALVLLDADRRVTAITFDPPAELVSRPDLTDAPGFEVEHCATMLVLIVDPIPSGELTSWERRGYFDLRACHALHGLELLDVIQTNGDRSRSLSIAADPESAWFQEPEAGATPAAEPEVGGAGSGFDAERAAREIHDELLERSRQRSAA